MNTGERSSLHSQLKQEAATHYDKLSYLETKKMELLDEKNSRETPEQERERLLKQVSAGPGRSRAEHQKLLPFLIGIHVLNFNFLA